MDRQECSGQRFAARTYDRGPIISHELDLSSPIVDFHVARSSAGTHVVQKLSVARDAEPDTMAGSQAQISSVIGQARFDPDTPDIPRELFQLNPGRRTPFASLIVER